MTARNLIYRSFLNESEIIKLLFLVLILLSPDLNAKPGDIDRSFNLTYLPIVTDVGSDNEEATAVAQQKDGKIILAGRSTETGVGSHVVLARYSASGELDASFGEAGIVKVDPNKVMGIVSDIAVQEDGKIVVSGVFDNNAVLLRFKENGILDAAFGNEGVVHYSPSNNGRVSVMALLDSGKIILGGHSNITSAEIWSPDKVVFTLVRFQNDGAIDTTFGSNGIVTTEFEAGESVINALHVQSDDKIVAVGRVGKYSSNDIAVARYDASGQLDLSFGDQGMIITHISDGYDFAHDVELQADGKIVVTGYSENSVDRDYILLRYKPDGELDYEFGVNGIVSTDVSGVNEGRVIAVQSDGKILVAGRTRLLRYDQHGVLDVSFGYSGVRHLNDRTSYLDVNDMLLQISGEVLLVGSMDFGGGVDFALVNYTVDGAVSENFSLERHGVALTGFDVRNAYSYAMAAQPDDKIILVGSAKEDTDSDHDVAISRYHKDGGLDLSFGTNGKVVTDVSGDNDIARSIMLQEDGKFIVAGSTYNEYTSKFLLIRYHIDGSLDNSFGDGGVVVLDAYGPGVYGGLAAIQSDGKIVIVGDSSNTTVVIARINNDGTLDASFGESGIVTLSGFYIKQDVNDVLILPDGKILVAGFYYNGYPNNTGYPNIYLYRFSQDGSKFGRVITGFDDRASYGLSIKQQLDGKILVIGSNRNDANDVDLVMVRYNEDLALDESFGVGGKVITDIAGGPHGAAIQGDGKIIISSNLYSESTKDILLERFDIDGTLDATFGNDGVVSTDIDKRNDYANSLLIQSDGGILVGGYSALITGRSEFLVARYLPDGLRIVSTPTQKNIKEDEEYLYQFLVSNDNNKDITITALTLPEWLRLTVKDVGSAILSGIPSEYDVGHHVVTLSVSDGLDYKEQTYAMQVVGVNDPPSDIILSHDTVNEGVDTTNAVVIGKLTVVDDDLNDAHSYTLSGDDSSYFQIVDEELQVRAGVNLDYETNNSYSIIVRVMDDEGLSYSKEFIISVKDLSESTRGGEAGGGYVDLLFLIFLFISLHLHKTYYPYRFSNASSRYLGQE